MSRGFYVPLIGQPSDINQIKVQVYRIDSSAHQIKFRCFILGQVAQINPFQWSTSEQVWPFEKNSSGNTLYCKEINFGALPNNGTKNVAHNISGFAVANLYRIEMTAINTTYGWSMLLPQVRNDSLTYQIGGGVSASNIYIVTAWDYTMVNSTVRIIYTKS